MWLIVARNQGIEWTVCVFVVEVLCQRGEQAGGQTGSTDHLNLINKYDNILSKAGDDNGPV